MYKLHRPITQDFLGLRMRNFQGIVFRTYRHIQRNFQICINVPLTLVFDLVYDDEGVHFTSVLLDEKLSWLRCLKLVLLVKEL